MCDREQLAYLSFEPDYSSDLSEDDLWGEDNWRGRSDDEPPYSRVPVPKKPNPNLPPLVMVVDEDGNDR
jgi:hypothetical protein